MIEIKKKSTSFLFGIFVFLFFALAFFWGYYFGSNQRKAIEGGVIVKAQIVNIGVSGTLWHTIYEYTDENGVRYSGRGYYGFSHDYEAESCIGKKIDIYIDGQGHSIAVGHKPGDRESIVVAIIFSCLTVLMVWLYIRQKKKDKNERLLLEQVENTEEEIIGVSFLDDLKKLAENQDVGHTRNDE
ncbi:MAG: hypothetical protein K2N32_01890 [Clostridia bacterium]|nr:hypothetical protein [Clostridia bacterium]MDE7336846.1 hypothetical protein [Clostridia bacterium]